MNLPSGRALHQPSNLLVPLLLSLLVGCSGETKGIAYDGSASGDGGAQWLDQAQPKTDATVITPPPAADLGTCGGTTLSLRATQPNVLLVFDRSCSMRRRFDDPTTFAAGPDDPTGRWYVARQAVDALTASFETRLRFGLLLFPQPRQSCGDKPALDVAPALQSRAAILARLSQRDVIPYTLCTPPNSTVPGEQAHVTPTADALESVRTISALKDPERENIVVLITDGHATCSATAASLAALTGIIRAMGIKTAVVGYGDAGSQLGLDMLNAIAAAGGLSPSTNPAQRFYLATDRPALAGAFDSIASAAISCRFKLAQLPPDGEKLFAYLDGSELPQDDPNGWSYDATTSTMELVGASCQKLKSGDVKTLKLVFGCPDPTCEPEPERCDGLDNDCDGKVDNGCLK